MSATSFDQARAPLSPSPTAADTSGQRALLARTWFPALTALAMLFAAALLLGMLVTSPGMPGHVGIVVAISGLLTLVFGGATLAYVLVVDTPLHIEQTALGQRADHPAMVSASDGQLRVAPRVTPRGTYDASTSSWPKTRTAELLASPKPPQPSRERTQAVMTQLQATGQIAPPAPPPLTMPKAVGVKSEPASNASPPSRELAAAALHLPDQPEARRAPMAPHRSTGRVAVPPRFPKPMPAPRSMAPR